MTYELYTAAQNAKSTHSGRGRSYYEVAANCGYQRYLADQQKDHNPYADKDWAIRGTYYHFLQEKWHRGNLVGEIELVQGDSNWKEAVTLFDWYRRTYNKNTWGDVVGVEEQFPVTDADKQRVADWFGIPLEHCPTIRLDLRTVMDNNKVQELATDHGMLVPGAGGYIIDFKTGAAHFGEDATKFTVGTQAVFYLVMVKRFLDPTLRAGIFNKVTLTKEKGNLTLKPTSFRTYLAYYQPSFDERVRTMVRYAYDSMANKTKNGFHCEECPFYKATNIQGICNGF